MYLHIGKNCVIKNSILWDNVIVKDNITVDNSIILTNKKQMLQFYHLT